MRKQSRGQNIAPSEEKVKNIFCPWEVFGPTEENTKKKKIFGPQGSFGPREVKAQARSTPNPNRPIEWRRRLLHGIPRSNSVVILWVSIFYRINGYHRVFLRKVVLKTFHQIGRRSNRHFSKQIRSIFISHLEIDHQQGIGHTSFIVSITVMEYPFNFRQSSVTRDSRNSFLCPVAAKFLMLSFARISVPTLKTVIVSRFIYLLIRI